MNSEPFSNPTPPTLPSPSGSTAPWDGNRRARFEGSCRGRAHRAVFGLTIVAWGGLLLLRELGLINPSLHVFDFWPLLLVGWGISTVLRWRNVGGVLVGAVVAAIGAGMLGERLGYVDLGVHRLWPVVIIAAGLAMILRRPGPRHRWRGPIGETVSADLLERSVTMGSLKLEVDSQQFKGARLGATMGEVQVDLRRAGIAGDEAAVEVSLVMGGIELYVPPNWQVVSDVSPFMGAVEDKTESRPDSAGIQKRLVIRGSITMGAVTIKN